MSVNHDDNEGMMRNKESKQEDIPRWMLTYADMVTLLLCFFVLLHAIGKATPQEVQLILSAFNDSLGFFSGGNTLSRSKLEELGLNLEALPSQAKAEFLSKAQKRARSLFKTELQAKNVEITETKLGITISLVGADYFDRGSAKLRPSIERVLVKASGLIQDLGRFVRVEGHSGIKEEGLFSQIGNYIQAERVYQNSWDLSAARAIHAISFMQTQGVKPSWLKAVGYGSYRPIKVVDKGTPESDAHNRRIDLILLDSKFAERSVHHSKYGLTPSLVPGSESLLKDH